VQLATLLAREAIAVQVVTPEAVLWEGQAAMVIARGSEGELGVLPLHAPLITALVDGPMRIRPVGGGPELVLLIHGGFLEVKPDRVTVLATEARWAEGGPREAVGS